MVSITCNPWGMVSHATRAAVDGKGNEWSGEGSSSGIDTFQHGEIVISSFGLHIFIHIYIYIYMYVCKDVCIHSAHIYIYVYCYMFMYVFIYTLLQYVDVWQKYQTVQRPKLIVITLRQPEADPTALHTALHTWIGYIVIWLKNPLLGMVCVSMAYRYCTSSPHRHVIYTFIHT